LPPDEEIAPLIRDLGDANVTVRERAGLAIFGRGCELAKWSTQAWLLDAELAACIVRGPAGIPEFTVGIAVQPQTFEKIRAACGSPTLAGVPPDQDAREFELEFSGGAHLDVLTTAEPGGSGAIARFLEKTGEAIQQVEIEVNDVDHATERLRARFGISPIYPVTRAGADGTRVNFFLAPTAENRKVLMELVENPQRGVRTALK
jgi:hypothetical protein